MSPEVPCNPPSLGYQTATGLYIKQSLDFTCAFLPLRGLCCSHSV